MLADGRLDRLQAHWRSVTRQQVYALRPGVFFAGLLPGWLTLLTLDAAGSLFDPAPLRALIAGAVDFERVRASSVRLLVVATDLARREPRLFDNATVGVEALMAAAAVPGAFPPVDVDGTLLVDGGLTGRAPVLEALAAGPPVARALVLLSYAAGERGAAPTRLRRTLEEAFEMAMIHQIHRDVELARLKYPAVDVQMVTPSAPLGLRPLDFDPAAMAAALERVAQLRAMEAESAARLSGEGEVLFAADKAKLSGYNYCSLAVNHLERGDLRLGIREASKALYLGQKGNDQWLLAAAKRDLAYAYDLAGYLDRSVQFADEALDHVARAGFTKNDPRTVIGPVYKIKGDADLRQGRADAAIANYRQALTSSLENFQPFVQASLGNAYLAQRDFAQARALFQQAEQGGPASVRLLVRRGQGQLALAEGNPQAAIAAFGAAAQQARGPDAEYHRVWALDGLARARQAAGDRDGALAAYGEALTAAERVRARFRSEEFKTGFFGDMQQVFDSAIALQMASGRAEAAFETSERSRARALLDLVRGRVKTSAGAEAVADCPWPS